jgi:hypothetical protein
MGSSSRIERSVPPGTARPHHVSSPQGTRMAHMCHRQLILEFVAKPVYAGRPACFAGGSTDDRDAPKGMRIIVVLVLGWDSLVQLSCGESQ